jgi:hypothetical protein
LPSHFEERRAKTVWPRRPIGRRRSYRSLYLLKMGMVAPWSELGTIHQPMQGYKEHRLTL